MHAYALPALTTLAAVLVYFILSVNVGRARLRYKVVAPAVTGDPAFERAFRAHMNTLEHMVAFLPALWLFAIYVSPAWASAFGAVWIVGRILYAAGYCRDAARRGPGFVIAFAGFAPLWLGATWGVVQALLRGA